MVPPNRVIGVSIRCINWGLVLTKKIGLINKHSLTAGMIGHYSPTCSVD